MEKSKQRICVIVDGYSAGAYLAPAFRKEGWTPIHVQSQPEFRSFFKKKGFRPSDYDENLICDRDYEKLKEVLKKLSPEFILPGGELGVSLSDRLREDLNLFPNNPRRAKARYDKYEMIEAVRREGVPVMAQFKTDCLNKIYTWLESSGLSEVVIKPLKSSCTDNVFICENKEEIKYAFQAIKSRPNIFDETNHEVLVQEVVVGMEYIVNTVSYDGRHRTCGVWEVGKKRVFQGGRVYDYVTVANPENHLCESIAGYCRDVLGALGLDYGPAHIEVMQTSDGPRLIEIGARMDGSNVFVNEKPLRCLETNQLEMTVEAFLRPQEFLGRVEQPNPVVQYAMEVSLIVPHSGLRLNSDILSELEALPSFWEIKLNATPEEKLSRTVDMMTSPGIVWLAASSREKLFKDLEKIRNLENRGLYVSFGSD